MTFKTLPFLFLMAIISACGGGGGGSSTPSEATPPAIQNAAPVLSAIGDVTVMEGEVAVAAVSASDSDGDTLTYSLSGDDSSLFELDASGNLSFAQAPDFELPTDADADNAYELVVRVNDPSNASDSESFSVTVTDALDGRVIDGPISDAQVELAPIGSQTVKTVVTDSEGFFNFGDVTTASGQRLVVTGGIDTFTGNALPDSVLVGEVGNTGSQLAQVNAITTLLAEVSSEDRIQVLSGLSISYSAEEIAVTDIWQLAQNGEPLAGAAQRANFQLAVLFSAINNLIGETALPLDVISALATEVAVLAVVTTEPLSLANETTLNTLITRSHTALGLMAPEGDVLDAFSEAMADLNTVLAQDALEPTSAVARDVASAVQQAFQASVLALAENNDVAAFQAAASLNTLFLGIDVGADAVDTDGDGLPNLLDADDDGDAVRDGDDAFPTDPSESADTDGDGVGDNADNFPQDPSETTDSDGDGVGDNSDAFPDDPSETLDSDNDGVGDNSDAFPDDPNETADSDGDGVGDNADAFPSDPNETADSDGDGVGDNADAFPSDPSETADSDGDGVGDNADAFPNDADESADSDGDGVGDNGDAFPNDPTETLDTDGDGVGNNEDEDDDGDGVNDEDDGAPLDPDSTGLFVSGQLVVNPETVLDSDTNNPENAFTRNNIVGDLSPDPETAQPLASPFILHGYVNKALAGAEGPLQAEGDDDDFFIVDALEGQRFILEIPDEAQDLDFYLYNETGEIIAASENPPGFVDSDGFQEVLTVPSTGRYFLNIYAYSFQGFPTASNYTVTTDFRGAPGAQRVVRPGEVIVGLKKGMGHNRLQLARAFDTVALRHELKPLASSKGKLRLMRLDNGRASAKRGKSDAKFAAFASQELRDASNVAHLIKALVADPDVEFAEPNYIYHRQATTNDPLLEQMWHLEQVNASTAWDTTTGAPDIVIAVIDSGTVAQHPDFLGQTTEGYDFVSATDNYDGDGIDADPEDATPSFDDCAQDDAFYHGAHTAGTVGATGNNAEGIAGLSYTSTLMHLRALDGDCGGSTYDIYQSLLYAIGADNDSGTLPNNPASIVNMSLGGGGSSTIFQELINQAAAQGVIVVAASGNAGANSVSFPAAYENTFAIGATGFDATVAGYSNQGPKLDLVAPGGGGGGGVLSLAKVTDADGNPEFTYAATSGTSMSTPHAAAIFALMKSVHPTLSVERLETLLASGALTEDLGDPGFDNESGWGLLKADKAVEVALADANGTFVMPARLFLSTYELYFGGPTTTALVSASNPGEVGLEMTSVDIDAGWITVSERTDTAPGEVGRWDVSVDRDGLEAGFYSGVVTYNAIDDEGNSLVTSIDVSLRVGKSAGGDLGVINVFITDSDSGNTTASGIASAADDYAYRVGLPGAGSYQITASTDTNGDGISCENGEACGRLGGLSSPQTLELVDSQSDLDITVLLPVEN